MKRKNKNRIRNMLMYLILAVLLVSGIGERGQVMEVAAAGSGSIMLTLSQTDKDGNKTVYPNIGMKLYKVGSMKGDGTMRFVTDSGFSSSGIDFNAITTADGWASAASALAGLADKSGVTPGTGVSDARGQLYFDGLAEGVYLVIQSSGEDQITVSPMILTVPFWENDRWNYQVNAYPKFTPKPAVKTSISVTKRLYHIDNDANIISMVTSDDTFKVGIFLDKEGTIPFRNDYMKDITIRNASNGTVSWDDMPAGTYYVFELDSDGKPMVMNQELKISDEKMFYYNVKNADQNENNQAVVDVKDNSSAVSYIDNYYYEVPDGYYLNGLVTINKRILTDGAKAETNEKFYAGVFQNDGSGDPPLVAVTELVNNGSVEVEVPLPAEEDLTDEVTYIVKETDKDGKPINKKGFAYQVSGEGKIVLTKSGEYLDGKITITNSKNTVTTTVTPTPADNNPPSQPSSSGGGSPQRSTPPSTPGNSPKTGDNTPVVMWIVIFIVAAVAASVIVIGKRKKK